MRDIKQLYRATALAVLLGLAAGSPTTVASNDIWDLMDPTWWMGLDDDDDDYWDYWDYGPGRYYDGGGPYGWGGPFGWGYPGWGYGGYPAIHRSAAVSEPEPAPEPRRPE